jgi:hypothetical protein
MSKPNLYHYYYSRKEDLFYKIHLNYLKKHLIPFIDEAEQIFLGDLFSPTNEKE